MLSLELCTASHGLEFFLPLWTADNGQRPEAKGCCQRDRGGPHRRPQVLVSAQRCRSAVAKRSSSFLRRSESACRFELSRFETPCITSAARVLRVLGASSIPGICGVSRTAPLPPTERFMPATCASSPASCSTQDGLDIAGPENVRRQGCERTVGGGGGGAGGGGGGGGGGGCAGLGGGRLRQSGPLQPSVHSQWPASTSNLSWTSRGNQAVLGSRRVLTILAAAVRRPAVFWRRVLARVRRLHAGDAAVTTGYRQKCPLKSRCGGDCFIVLSHL